MPDVSVADSFILSPDLAAIVRPAMLWWRDATVTEHHAALDTLLAEAEAALRANACRAEAVGEGGPPADTAAVRTMYKRSGLDPTKTRPSSEALLRRILKGGAIPRINALVDVINWCSVEFQLPYGLYDSASIRGVPTVRLGRPGEEYAGIRKDTVHVAGRITVADDEGPFGNPTSDSARTMVTTATTDALVVVYAPAEFPRTQLEGVLQTTADRIARVCGGREAGSAVA
jgi:DNA/RNA-binding domain of Phe-tRNA-synthetase-like protein